MNLYELILIIRQDVSKAEVDKVSNMANDLIKKYNGKTHDNKYAGLLNLAYEIKNNKKGHYVLINMEANNDLLAELDRKLKLDETVIRHSIVNVESFDSNDVKTVFNDPSLNESHEAESSENTIDVTSEK